MNRIVSFLLIFILATTSLFAQRQDQLLTDWQFSFMKTDTHGNQSELLDWSDVKVPHDWAIYGPFDRENDIQTTAVKENFETKPRIKTGRTGGLPYMQKAQYKTTIHIAEEQLKKGNRFTLLFDGVMSEAQVFDVYEGEHIEEGKKSVAISVTYSSDDHTLSDKEITEMENRIKFELTKQFKAELRS